MFIVNTDYTLKEGSIQIFNITGQFILEEQLTTESTIINCSNLKKGIYIYKIKIEDATIKTEKLLIY